MFCYTSMHTPTWVVIQWVLAYESTIRHEAKSRQKLRTEGTEAFETEKPDAQVIRQWLGTKEAEHAVRRGSQRKQEALRNNMLKTFMKKHKEKSGNRQTPGLLDIAPLKIERKCEKIPPVNLSMQNQHHLPSPENCVKPLSPHASKVGSMAWPSSVRKNAALGCCYVFTTTDQCSHPSRPLMVAILFGISSPWIAYYGLPFLCPDENYDEPFSKNGNKINRRNKSVSSIEIAGYPVAHKVQITDRNITQLRLLSECCIREPQYNRIANVDRSNRYSGVT
ncbi:hypothetical protein T05_10177 [Trichinella murrelli]|uniref:Uncharacterized protein n=1 Tax=Trichinella murrelli TaxID=144512 RepID=A0A0V0TX14_9BILA|nr:hypothetical protein T05_10177 [Trichinella murrelli]